MEESVTHSPLQGKHILLGITGGIAAYKSAYLTRLLKKEGADVWVCMTESGTKFITPLTMESLSEREVLLEMFPEKRVVGTRHISIADWADLVIIAPATANTLARLRAGIANDLLTTIVISTTAPIFIAPAMNTNMYQNPATQENLAVLQQRGVQLIEPGSGDLACRTVGVGRMAEPDEIVAVVHRYVSARQDLANKKVVVTAGPTYEAIDPVRFLGNRSSGKMGYALAREAATRGAEVILISGPTALSPPTGVSVEWVESTAEMKAAVDRHYADSDVVIMAAAVADYRPAQQSEQKMKRSASNVSLTLSPTEDILGSLAERKTKQLLVGFALETENLIEAAQAKLKEKRVDLIVANNPLVEGAAFGSDTNIAVIIDRENSPEETGKISKRALSAKICDRIVTLMQKGNA